MQGDKKVVAKNKNNHYEFTLHRNLTILRGNSGSGKTKLFELIADYNRFGKSSDAKVSSDCPVIAYEGRNWERDMERLILKQKISNGRVAICLPESFEWRLLASEILKYADLNKLIDFENDKV